MIRRVVAILLLTTTFVQTLGQGLVLLQFYANQDYIARNLCVNRNKPLLKCCGLCQLNKKLKEEDKKAQRNPERRPEAKFETLFFSEPILDQENLATPFTPSYPPMNAPLHSGNTSGCYHPPSLG